MDMKKEQECAEIIVASEETIRTLEKHRTELTNEIYNLRRRIREAEKILGHRVGQNIRERAWVTKDGQVVMASYVNNSNTLPLYRVRVVKTGD